MKIASKRALDDMYIATELRVPGATWDAIAQAQIGTMGTTLLRSSRAWRKVRIRKVIHHVPEVGREAPDHKLSLFVPHSWRAPGQVVHDRIFLYRDLIAGIIETSSTIAFACNMGTI
jgi:hypothetical protein